MNKNFVIGWVVVVLILGTLLIVSLVNKSPTIPATGTPSPTVSYEGTTPPSSVTAPAPSPAAPTPDAPVVETDQNVVPSSSTGLVNGHVKPNGAATTYWFEYGETTAFGHQSVKQAIGSGYTLLPTPGYITGLKANTQY